MFDVQSFRQAFPQIQEPSGDQQNIYFDSGASTLKHRDVIERVHEYNRGEVANVHRGAHRLSREGTDAYEKARGQLARFIGAEEPSEIVWTRGTTESINLIAQCFEPRLKSGDEILISSFEHHSNIVPWQVLCDKVGAKLVVVPFDKQVGLRLEDFEDRLTEKTALVATLFYSNSFGNRLPVEAMIGACEKRNIPILIDAAQAVLTEKIDVKKLRPDFLCFSGHKMFAPYGIGICYMKKQWAEDLPPYQTGGSMIDRVSFEKTTYALAPQKFEAGTPNISGAIGMGLAAERIQQMDFEGQHQHVLKLRQMILEKLKNMESVDLYNFSSEDYSGVVSFNVKGAHPSDVGTLLDKYGVAVRAGHHCTQPLMELMNIPGTVRVSLSAYNTEEEVHFFIQCLEKVQEFF